MKLRKLHLPILAAAVMSIVTLSCKDDFTEADLIQKESQAKKSLTASDSLNFVFKMDSLAYRKYLDSLSRADSIAVAMDNAHFLPYSYEVQILNGSLKSINNGRTERTQAFSTDVTVTITQYGVKQTRTSKDGLFTFSNIGRGMIHGTVEAAGFTTFTWTVDASIPYDLVDVVADLFYYSDAEVSSGLLAQLAAYMNERSIGNDFTIFETAGTNTSVLTGRAFIETNTTNKAREVVPTGTTITAYIDADDATFENRYVFAETAGDDLNSVFQPLNWSYEFVATAATDASGDFSLTLPSSPDGVAIRVEYSDVVADKVSFLQTNGDVTAITRRNIYGPRRTYSQVPLINLAPTVTFDAGGGATATALVGGDGSITDLDLTNGGKEYQGTPRVIISAPDSPTGTQAVATATVTGGVVTALTLTTAGSGYTSAPTVTITEGSGATATTSGFTYGSTSGGVASVQLTSLGTGFNGVLPNVVFYVDINNSNTFDVGEQLTAANFPTGVNLPGPGLFSTTDFPTAVAVNNTGNTGLSAVNVTNSGSGMSFQPKVIVTSGLGGVVTVTTTGGVVTGVTVTNGGLFYSAPPTITVPTGTFGTPTTPAVLTAVLTGGVITGVTITNAGAGYTDATGAATVTAIGSGATATLVWKGQGLGSITVGSSGNPQVDNKYYTNAPKVVIPAPDYKGPGSRQATATAVLTTDGRVVAVNLTDAGSGYDPALSHPITLLSGSSAAATATLGNRFIDEIDVVLPGSNYIVAPTVLIVDLKNRGTGATAVAKLSAGEVTSIEVTNGGSGYVQDASLRIIILDPGTSYDAQTGAVYANTAKANVFVDAAGKVSLVDLYQAGDNYPAGTRVNVVSLKGSGFTATSTVTAGKVTDVTITSGGAGYVGNNYLRLLGAAMNPDSDVTGGVSLPGSIPFSGVPNFNSTSGISTYVSKTAVKKVYDVDYGSGQNND